MTDPTLSGLPRILRSLRGAAPTHLLVVMALLIAPLFSTSQPFANEISIERGFALTSTCPAGFVLTDNLGCELKTLYDG